MATSLLSSPSYRTLAELHVCTFYDQDTQAELYVCHFHYQGAQAELHVCIITTDMLRRSSMWCSSGAACMHVYDQGSQAELYVCIFINGPDPAECAPRL